MAKQVSYTTQPATMPSPRDELEDLVRTLSESGALRVLNGFFGRFGAVADVALDEANSPGGRRILGSAALLLDFLAKLPAEQLERVSIGLERGLGGAADAIADDPPSTLQLLRLARDPDTRRAIGAILHMLNALGAALAAPRSGREAEGGKAEGREG